MTKNLAEETGAALFGFSDIHAHYLLEHYRIGKLFFSSFPRDLIDPEHMTDSLREMMRTHKDKIEIKGHPGSVTRTLAWKAHSAVRDPIGNVKDVIRLFTQ